MHVKKIVWVIITLGLIALLIRYCGLDAYLSFEHIKQNRERLLHCVDQYPVWSVYVYILVCAAIIGVGIPIIGILTLVGGYMFGVLYGTLYATIGATLGVVVMFLAVRYIIMGSIKARYGRQLAQFNTRLQTYGYTYLLTLHWMTIIPYSVVAILAALADVPLLAVIWTTIVGSIPMIFIYALAGRQLGTVENIGDIFSFQVIMAFILLALLALIPMCIRRVRELTDIS
jgi:uncharacterized membrane protein YdjX (TVP38/TMEM64 family)